MLFIISPLLVVVSIAVRLSSPGPILFTQMRPGLHGKPFRILKFRTMFIGSEKMEKGKEVSLKDPRISALGRILRRTKIDELPQLINVLKGDMSLVGPRPERMESLSDYDEEIWKRLEMKPGMTGLAQISGNIYLDVSERYKLDIRYVENFSLILDFKIIFKTIGVVIFGEEKYKER